jgi:membrane-associated protease RseP (regulator of RpoE activity)
MLEAILYSVAAFVAWLAGIAAYHFSIAAVATRFGIRVVEVGVGFGPALLRRTVWGWPTRLNLILTGGYTKFLGEDDDPDAEGRYQDAPASAQMLIALTGPLVTAGLGLVLLAMPVWAGARQLEVCPPEESEVRPCGVGGLALRDQPTTWARQGRLFRDSAGDVTVRVATFQSLTDRGGLIAFVVTSGVVGEVSSAAWLSCVGVLLIWVGAVNLLPIPLLNGYQFLVALGRGLTGRQPPWGVEVWLYHAGLLVVLFALVRIVWADIRWLWDAFA